MTLSYNYLTVAVLNLISLKIIIEAYCYFNFCKIL
jgi:hypothetical protein